MQTTHFAASAFPVPSKGAWNQRETLLVSLLSQKAPARLGSSSLSLSGAQENGARKRKKFMSYLNSVTIIGFVGADPEERQARNNNGGKFTELFLTLGRAVATQRSLNNTDDEWASKTEWHCVCVFRPRLAEYVATTIKKGSHVLVEGSLVSTTYERNGGWKKSGGPSRLRTSKPPHSKLGS